MKTLRMLRLASVLGSTLVTLQPHASAQAADYICTISGGTITITDYMGPDGAVIIPDTINGLPVTGIGQQAFSWCTGLTSVTIPSSITSIGGAAFVGNFSLGAITVDANNPAFSSLDGALFNKSQTTLVQYPGGKTGSYTIPNGVTSIGVWAFSACTGLTNVAFPGSVISIGDWAFYSCTSLTSVTIPDRVTGIGGYAFTSCSSLTSVTIGSSVTSIGSGAFENCSSLRGAYFVGNVPFIALSPSGYRGIFNGATKETVHYLPGTTGWGTTFSDRPTAVWKPQVQTSDTSFGVRTNQFGFNINWATGKSVVVEASTSLVNPTWSPVSTNTLTEGSSYFRDPQWTEYPTRFYRIRSP